MIFMGLIINVHFSIREALAKLEYESHHLYTLFVVDDYDKMVGTITDGDIRRYLMQSGDLTDEVCKAMNTQFCALNTNEDLVLQIKKNKKRGVKLMPILSDNGKIIDSIDLVNYKSRLPIDAILMAGGKGERLRPLTEKIPKPLLKVGKKTIIDHNVDRLISFGVEHISVTVNYLKEQLETHFAEPRNGIVVKTVSEQKFLGTMGAVKLVNSYYNDTVLVMNSDLFTNIDYEDFYLHFIQCKADMGIAAIPYTISIPYGIMDLDGQDVKNMIEKPCYTYYANAGIYLIKRSLIDLIPHDKFYNATDFIVDLIKRKKSVIRYPINGTWIDIGTPQEYAKAKDLVTHLNIESY